MRSDIPPHTTRRDRKHASNAANNPWILLADQVRCMLENRLLENWFQGRFKRQGLGPEMNLRVREA
jgi:hypothetical protein